MDITEASEAKGPQREGILAAPERHLGKVFVEVSRGSGRVRKEIGELSRAEVRALEPGLRIRVVNRLLGRYMTKQAHFDFMEGETPHANDTGNIAPANLRSADLVGNGTCA